MTEKQLKNSILQWAIQGKLVPQDPNNEPASVLLERIREEKKHLIKEGKIKKDKNETIIYRGEDNSYYEKFLATGEVTCIDDEIPFEIPRGWAWCRLGSISSLCTGATFKKEEVCVAQKGIRVLRGGNILPFKLCLKPDDIFIPSQIVNANILLRANDIVTPAVTSLENIGKMARVEAEMPDTTVGGFVFIIRPIEMSIHFSKYLLTFMSSPVAIEYIKSITNKSGQAFYNIGKERLLTTLVPLPPTAEQKRLTDKLDELLIHIEAYGSIQNELNSLNLSIKTSLKKSILQEAIKGNLVPQISEEGTAQELLEQIKQERARLVKEGKLKKSALQDSVIYKGDDNKYYERVGKEVRCIDEEIPFEIPQGWEWCRLGMVLEVSSARRVHEKDWRTSGVPFYRAREIGKLADYGYVDNNLFIDKSLYEDFIKSGIPRVGDLMMTAVGTLGKTYIVTDEAPFYYKDGSVLCIGNPHRLNPFFLKYFFESSIFSNQYVVESDGTTVATLTMVRLNRYYIPIPPLQEQARIVAKIEELNKIIK